MDRYLEQQIKKWALTAAPPMDSKQRLMLKAATLSMPSGSGNPITLFFAQIFYSVGSFERYPAHGYGELLFPHPLVPTRLLAIIT